MKKLKNGSVLLLLTAMLLPAWSVAQDNAETQLISVRTVTTHVGQTDTWIEQQGKSAAARTERGAPERHVWQEIDGNLDTFHIVSYPENFAGRDEPNEEPLMGDAQEEWFATTGPTVASRSSMVLRNFLALSIPPDEGSEPALLVLRRISIAPGNIGAYNAWLRDKFVPALKLAGATGVNTSRVISGGDTNMWIRSTRVANFAALDEPGPFQSLSGEERAAMFAGSNEIVWSSERLLLRYRADMSNAGPSED